MLEAKRLALLVVCAGALAPLQAQVSTGEIAGTIADASGAAVPKAKVTAVNTQTKLWFAKPSLPPKGLIQ